MSEKRNTYLDGLRGIAAVIVVFYHSLLSFYPAIFTLQVKDSHTTQNSEADIGNSIFSFLFNGNFAVCLFFVLSGYALSIRFFANKEFGSPVSGILKRYIRLVIPISISVLLSYIILVFHGYSNIQTGNNYSNNNFWFSKLWNITPQFFSMLKEGFINSVMDGGNIDYNPILWTMSIEFKGSLLVYAFLALFGRIKNRFFIYIVLICIFYKSYFLAFILGISLCDYRFGKYYKHLSVYITAPLLLISLYLGSFELVPLNPKSGWGFLDRSNAEQNQIIYIIGSTFMLISLIHWKAFQNILSANWLLFLGKISFSLYLLHLIILGSFTCYAFKLFYVTYGLNYHLSFATAFFLSICLLAIISNYYYKYIDLQGIRLSHKIYLHFFNQPD